MFYIYVLLLCNNIIMIVSSDLSINKIQNLPDFTEIKEIIKETDDKKALSLAFDKIIKKYKNNQENKIVEVLDNLDLDDFMMVDTLYSENISISALEEEIDSLNSVRQDMLIFENIIKSTDINLTNLCNDNPVDYSIAKYINDKAKVEKVKSLSKTITSEQLKLYNRGQHHLLNQDVISKIKDFLEFGENSVMNTKIKHVELIIAGLYSSYIFHSKVKVKYSEHDAVLQAYATKHYNNQVRKELKELEDKHGSIKNIIAKLTFAYTRILEL